MYFCLKLPSASSWGCELKFFDVCGGLRGWLSASSWGCELKLIHFTRKRVVKVVSLFVRLWVEMQDVWRTVYRTRSASSWGCELKCNFLITSPWSPGQPLREAVSWNIISRHITEFGESQPLREAVSWNTWTCCEQMGWLVSLFVRLWVEILLNVEVCRKHFVSLFVRLWVEIILQAAIQGIIAVSLFVRLWVEIFARLHTIRVFPVSLFVRLWVEMWHRQEGMHPDLRQPLREAVSWNRKREAMWTASSGRQPLREAVSWNSSARYGNSLFSSASSWGCELK